MARGPAKKPTALELAQGSPGHRPVNSREPKFKEGEPAIPSGLSPRARKIWRESVSVMLTVQGLLTIADGAVMADYCQVRAEKEEMLKALEFHIRDRAAKSKKPAVVARMLARETEMKKIANGLNKLRHRENVLRRELGLSPSSRSSIRLPGGRRESASPVDSALFGRRSLVAV